MLKRVREGTFHNISPTHLNRYVQEFAGKHNIREEDTLDQMRTSVRSLLKNDPHGSSQKISASVENGLFVVNVPFSSFVPFIHNMSHKSHAG